MSGPRNTRMATKTGELDGLTNRGREAYALESSSLSASAAGRGAASKEAAPVHFSGAAERLTSAGQSAYIRRVNTPVSFGEGARSRFSRIGSCFWKVAA
jgi:hypothetical protein